MSSRRVTGSRPVAIGLVLVIAVPVLSSCGDEDAPRVDEDLAARQVATAPESAGEPVPQGREA
ncbi:MAG: hypothetical protein K1X94_20800, partial [Sandaracinaceae bacterium]|nr:hypothetical protein [Sandaracinaceae bacterium]